MRDREMEKLETEENIAIGGLDFCVGSYLDGCADIHGPDRRKVLNQKRRAMAEAHQRYKDARAAVGALVTERRDARTDRAFPPARIVTPLPPRMPGGGCNHRWTGGPGFRECVWCSLPHPKDAQ